MNPSPSFGTIWKDALPERISARILELIAEKQLRAGDKLPPERELAVTMHVSRPSIREALRALAMMNVVEIRQGSGTYITSLDPGLLVEHMDFVFSLDNSTFVQLFEARKILEVGIAALAAQRITSEEIAGLEASLEKCRGAVDDSHAFQEADQELHDKIVAAARNPILTRFMASVSRLGQASRSRTVQYASVRRQSVEDHCAIVAALKAHDPDAAYYGMLRHLISVGTVLEAEANHEAASFDQT